MKKFLYIMPAVLILMLYALLAALAGGISGFQPIAYAYMLLPVGAGVLLQKGKWWGCLLGIAMGGLLLYMGSQANGQTIDIERPMGIGFLVFTAFSKPFIPVFRTMFRCLHSLQGTP